MKKSNLIMKGTLSVAMLVGCLFIGAKAKDNHDQYKKTEKEYEQIEREYEEIKKERKKIMDQKLGIEVEAASNQKNDLEALEKSTRAEKDRVYKELLEEYSRLSDENLYKDEQIKQLGGTPKKLYDENINSSISYLGKEYPIVQGFQYDIDMRDVRWIDITARYKDIESEDPTPKTSVDDNKGLYLAASHDLKFVQDLRDKVDKIVYKDSKGNKLTYCLEDRIEIPREQCEKGWVSSDETLYKYMAGEVGNIIAIQVTYEDDITTEILIFKTKKEYDYHHNKFRS